MIDVKFKPHWRTYILQVCGATLYLAVAILVVDSLANLAVVSSIAASAFLTFSVPKSIMASPRNTLGGFVAAVIVALAASPFVHDPAFPDLLDHQVAVDIITALAVGLTMLVMAVTNTEHAPAAAAALGLTFQPWTAEAAASLLLMTFLLVLVQVAGRGRLVNLL